MKKIDYNKKVLVWENDIKQMRVWFYVAERKLILEWGNRVQSLHLRIDISDLWKSICEFMRSENKV